MQPLRSRKMSSHRVQQCLIYSVKKTSETAKNSGKLACSELWALPKSLSCFVFGELGYPELGCCVMLEYLGVMKSNCVGRWFPLRHWCGHPHYQPLHLLPLGRSERAPLDGTALTKKILHRHSQKHLLSSHEEFHLRFPLQKLAVSRHTKAFTKVMICSSTSMHLSTPVNKERLVRIMVANSLDSNFPLTRCKCR